MVGCFDEFHRGLLELLWKQYRFLTDQVTEIDSRIERAMEPHRELIDVLKTIPGVDRTVAWTVIAEMGTDMTVFPDAGHAASWVGVCPGTNESAGKQMDAGTTKGNRYLRALCYKPPGVRRARKTAFCRRFFIV